jgi:hypothetical protein
MIVKIHQAGFGILQHANELLQAHQVVIDTWYDTWAREQRSKATELLRRRHQDLSENQPKAE